MKKLFSGILIGAAMLCTALAGYAAEADFNIEITDAVNSEITVSGVVENKQNLNETVGILVMDESYTIADYQDYTLHLGWTVPDFETGEYSYTFSTQAPTGSYGFYVTIGDNTYNKVYDYIAMTDVVDMIKKIRDGEIKAEDSLSEVVAKNNGLGVNLDAFNSENGKKLFAYRIERDRNLISQSSDNQAIIKSFLDLINDISAERRYLEQLLNVNQWSEVKIIIAENKYTGINLTVFQTLTNQRQAEICSAFMGKDYVSGDALKAEWDSKVVLQSPINPPYAVNGGGGGGGGGGSSFKPAGQPLPLYEQSASQEVPFDDISSVSWAAEAIVRLYQQGIISGVGDRSFNPDGDITREEFAKLLSCALGVYDSNATCEFEDAADGWWAPYVASLKNAGLVQGISKEIFGVGHKITRQDMAVMIYNGLSAKGAELLGEGKTFSDSVEIDSYAGDAVAALTGSGIINGMTDGTFMPKANATRAQAAVLIYGMMSKIKE